ncbi:hypothetical protein ACOBQJ_02260 [Pelotomaculum propionicicum]|uniref:hypothetical protein n=1 Tax=Pelotomaculum propionicicum TaxID=258475 RepID=UPI003B82341D
MKTFDQCVKCPIRTICGDKDVPVAATILADQYSDDQKAFAKGDTVIGIGKVVDNTVYCIKADNIFLQLERVGIITPVEALH